MKATIGAIIACAACWAVVPSVATAHPGEPKAPPLASPAMPDQVQAIADRTRAWLEETLRASIDPRPFLITNDMDELNDAEYRVGFAEPDHVRLRPYLAEYLLDRTPDLEHRGRFYSPGAASVVHELLHRRDTVRCWGEQPGGINVEEGIVDALTADLMPAWGWRFWRARMFSPASYPADTAAIRAASARATGSKTWRTRDARSWRRAIWGASCGGRAAMLAAAAR
jgi:hypothetical protein